MARKALTSDQVKQRFRQRGKTIVGWARSNGYEPRDVYRVLSGVYKGNYGTAHQIAVDLGMKVVDELPEGNTQDRAAA